MNSFFFLKNPVFYIVTRKCLQCNLQTGTRATRYTSTKCTGPNSCCTLGSERVCENPSHISAFCHRDLQTRTRDTG